MLLDPFSPTAGGPDGWGGWEEAEGFCEELGSWPEGLRYAYMLWLRKEMVTLPFLARGLLVFCLSGIVFGRLSGLSTWLSGFEKHLVDCFLSAFSCSCIVFGLLFGL